uniref:Uncharacterized protein n=1 Tax=Rhizophora mucronata TaxID=61149 RepID=A0A2P2IJD3_RHIMU
MHNFHSDSMPTKGVKNVGSPSEVEDQFGWTRVFHSFNLPMDKGSNGKIPCGVSGHHKA